MSSKLKRAIVSVVTAFCLTVPAVAKDDVPSLPDANDAPIALLVDAGSGQVLFSRNPDLRFMPASITKVMTVYTAFRLVREGKLSLVQHFPYTDTAFAEWDRKGSSLFLPRGANPSVDLLLRGITTVSANDGAVVLAEGAGGSVAGWTRMMNANARRLGMRDSHFNTPNGWPDQGGTFVTAHDLVILGRAMVNDYPTLFRRYVGKPGMRAFGIAQDNHDPILGKVEGADGIKTGFTNQAGYGFLGTAERDGRRLMLVVATSDTWRQRNAAARDLMEWGFARFANQNLFPAGKPIAMARVQNGSASELPLIAPRPVRLSVPQGNTGPVKVELLYDGPLEAPIAKGEEVARLKLTAPGLEPSTVPLVAGEAVERAGPLRRIVNGFSAFLR
ncbi:D-alanyl-D-alanine carboxypeptidase [Erythrobacter sp. LQ02-29]|uniref:D-alanyl-D-alanine carboxypeptidase family protein n=1 Tax=Erythrobacter sp. LQ02-29 TaxID=2920384 RepID=UPI001F4E4C0D|nr:D-alanyl-D-alanine carboxypeptidase [Erythrobacter sp. LQ02-29]